MEIFPFTLHKFQTIFPDRKNKIALGGGYEHITKPNTPAAKTFRLTFRTMCYVDDAQGNPDAHTDPKTNLLALEQFYARHETYEKFLYDHPVYGTCQVTFNQPFTTPELLDDGNGACAPFTIELKEHPV